MNKKTLVAMEFLACFWHLLVAFPLVIAWVLLSVEDQAMKLLRPLGGAMECRSRLSPTCMLLLATVIIVSSLAQGATGYLRAESINGLVRECYYLGISNSFMRTIGLHETCPDTADDSDDSVRQAVRKRLIGQDGNFLLKEKADGNTRECVYATPFGRLNQWIPISVSCPRGSVTDGNLILRQTATR